MQRLPLSFYRTENQFVGHRVPVKQHLQAGVNTLLLTFSSAFRKVLPAYIQSLRHKCLPKHQGRETEEKHGKLNLWNGDSSRLHVRKAQYKCALMYLHLTRY